MTVRSLRTAVPLAVATCAALALAAPAAGKELKGAAILAHPCGKVALQHMGLVHEGKIEEATKLGTKSMQDEWAAMPKEDREMMSGMMKELSMSREDFSKAIESFGTLTVEEKAAKLEVVKETKDDSGTSKETTTQKYELDGDVCRITR